MKSVARASCIIVIFASVIFLADGVFGEDPLVTLEQGNIKGNLGTARNGRQFYEFLGVPYGKVPKRFGVCYLFSLI